MAEFAPGDRVSFVNEEGEGKVVSIIDAQNVLIQLEEGLEVPVNKQAIVKAKDFFEEKEQPKVTEDQPQEPDLDEQQGIYLAFDKSKSDQFLELYLINNTYWPFYFTFYEMGNDGYQGISRGALEPAHYQLINRVKISEFEKWKPFLVQGLYYYAQSKEAPDPINYVFKPRPKSFFKSIGKAPILKHEAYLFKLAQSEESQSSPFQEMQSLDPEQLFKSGEQAKPNNIATDKPPEVVDLHIEKLSSEYEAMTRDAILDYQMNYFQDCLEKAIAFDYQKIIFIHGIGNGVLRERLQLNLKRNKKIKGFGEANYKKYGLGATEVQIK